MMETTISSPVNSSDVQEPPSSGKNATIDITVPKTLVDVITSTLEDGKADDVTVIDLASKSSIADYMVVASGRSGRQVGALADQLVVRLKELGLLPATEGKANSDWVVVDAASVVVHLFRPEVRAFYNLEKMWSRTPTVEEAESMPPFDQPHIQPMPELGNGRQISA